MRGALTGPWGSLGGCFLCMLTLKATGELMSQGLDAVKDTATQWAASNAPAPDQADTYAEAVDDFFDTTTLLTSLTGYRKKGSTPGDHLAAINEPGPVKKDLGLRYDLKHYVREMETATGRRIPDHQRQLLKQAIREKEFKKLSKKEYDRHKDAFKKKRDQLRKEWSRQTGQEWPIEAITELNEQGKLVRTTKRHYDAHEIIPNERGGPLEWWNIHPARFPGEHQSIIHGKDAKLTKILKENE